MYRRDRQKHNNRIHAIENGAPFSKHDLFVSRRMIMKLMLLLICLIGTSIYADGVRIAPELDPLSHEEIGQWIGKIIPTQTIDKSIIRRGLVSGQTALRADCARYLAHNGDISDLPYLIDALSDESVHDGVSYSYAGMATTRYWANVALICITKQDLGYRWADPVERRQEAINRWKNHWNSVKHRIEG